MVGSVERNGNDGLSEVGGKDGSTGSGRGGEREIKLALSGCHDTTLAAVLASLGAFEGEKWPPYTSHIALELFKKPVSETVQVPAKRKIEDATPVAATGDPKIRRGWFGRVFGDSSVTDANGDKNNPLGIARRKVEELVETDRSKLDDHFVRIRYNDKVMFVPGCRPTGKHLDGDESFCTLVSFFTLNLSEPRSTDLGPGGIQVHCRQVYPFSLEESMREQHGCFGVP